MIDNNFMSQYTYSSKQSEVHSKAEVGDMYTALADMPVARPTFLWGKAVGQDPSTFSKEDLAATLHYTLCTNLVTNVLDSLVMLKTKHVFVGGSFVNHPLTQRLVFEHFEYQKRELAMALPGFNGDVYMHIMDYGSHLGALGMILIGHENLRKEIE